MSIIHFLLIPLYIIIPVLAIIYYRVFYLKDRNDKYFFLAGFLLKIFGAVASVVIYKFYYGGGDSTTYFYDATILADYLFHYPEEFLNFIVAKNSNNLTAYNFLPYNAKLYYGTDIATFTVLKIATIFNLLTYNSYLLTSILCSYFAFLAAWVFYKFIKPILNSFPKSLGYAIFFMPSVVFWGSGLFKDTFTLAGLYFFIVGVLSVFGYNKWKISNIIFILIGFYLMSNIRSFFILIVTPALLYWIANKNYMKIPNVSLRIIIIPIVALIMIASIAAAYNVIMLNFTELNVDNIEDRAKGFQNWHTHQGGSSYSLGEIDYSLSGIIRKIPDAIIVTYFRPFIWEANKPIVFLSFLQSFGFVLFTLYIFYKMRFIYFFTYFFRTYQGVSLLMFSLFYAFVAGFISFNFGALDRYKIPCLSTYVIAFLFIYNKYLKSKGSSK